ncbi:MAG: ATP-binding cassette domain-containing protein [Sulfurimonas sp.]
MNNLAYIYKLWISIAQTSGKLTTSDVLLAAKRLVEGQSDEEISLSIDEFDKFAKDISLDETIEYLHKVEPSKKYVILINLFMVIMLKNINKERVNKTQIATLKDIYLKLELPYLYDILYLLMIKKYERAHSVLQRHTPNINFICFDENAKSELNQSFKAYQVSFIVLHIDNFFLLLNHHSHDLNIYTYQNDSNTPLHNKCMEFRDEPYSFLTHNIRDHSIYYLDENSFIRISNKKELIYLDANALQKLFSPTNDKKFLTTDIVREEENNFVCSIVKDHIYSIIAKDLSAGYKKKQAIIKEVNFNIQVGEFVAIMGPSGSGKTTLLRTFVEQAKLLKGELLINGEKLSQKYFHRMGYVPQDDVLIKDLNVYDNMYYYYRLHFGSEKTDGEVDKLISTQLRNLGILDIKNSPVFQNGKFTISGGQRKRLNIALELLKDVDLILMDEPTSGLSSLDSEKIISELKKITRLNKIVIINIHQPSTAMYRQFDQVIVFNEDGNNIYTNRSIEVLKIFKLVKTEDAYMFNDESENTEDLECMKCEKSDPELLLEIQADEKSNFWNLFSYLNNFTEK